MTQLQHHTQCLVCESDQLKQLIGYEKDFLVQCRECGFVFCERVPSAEELNAHYQGYPRNTGLSEITRKRYNELLDKFEKYRKTGKILDGGCGDGYFLEEAAKRNWEVFGTEVTENAVQNCREKNIAMFRGTVEDAAFSENEFDVITSFEVIEHVNNPRAVADAFAKFLRPGGLLYVTTPNFKSFSRKWMKGNWKMIEYPEHLAYFTPKTMHRLLKQRFNRVKVETTGINPANLKDRQAAENNHSATSVEELRSKTETRLVYKILKNVINSGLNTFRIGDGLKVWYQKQ